jgi:hypothetical protein
LVATHVIVTMGGYVWNVNTCVSKEIVLVATHVIVTMGMYGMLIHVLVRK